MASFQMESASLLPTTAEDDELRSKVLDGLPPIRSKRQGDPKLYAIAVFRSVLFALFALAAVVGTHALLHNGRLAGTASTHDVQLDCAANGSLALRDSAARAVFKRSSRMRFSFKLEGSLADDDCGLEYWKNVEDYFVRPTFQRALSFGVAGSKPVDITLKLDLRNKTEISCDALARFACDELSKATRTNFEVREVGPLSIYSGLLVRTADMSLFSLERDTFTRDWNCLAAKCWTALLIIFGATFSLYLVHLFIFGMRAQVRELVASYVAQYDYLWTDNALYVHEEATSSASFSVDVKGLFICSPFFVIDDIRTDVWTVAGSWRESVLTSFLHGLTCLALPLFLPIVAAVFVPSLRPLVNALSIALAACGTTVATFYYFGFNSVIRTIALGAFVILFYGCILVSFVYFVFVVVYLVTRVISDPDRFVDVFSPVVSVFIYVLLMVQTVSKYREKVKEVVTNKAELTTALTDAGLTFHQIVAQMVVTILLLTLLLCLLFLTAVVHSGTEELSNPAATLVSPITVVVRYVQQTTNSRSQLEKKVFETTDTVLKAANDGMDGTTDWVKTHAVEEKKVSPTTG
eukprot:TRINITY_DN8904_c0_g1_i5.p1 TRINITY_DN8904_c0_g1~~TRINITY_DN8904_c0_g1_i5.p1  ORF type:complete len:578 (-),score=82.15 TRINITY_DN8904_c0_g1_i5:414-2147(-)